MSEYRKKQTRKFDVQKINRATAPTPPVAKPAPKKGDNAVTMSETQRRRRDSIVDRLLRKGGR